MFSPLEGQVSFPKLEEEIVRFWRENRVYQQSLDRREGAPPFVFYEGPPTANGMPHPGHCLTRTIKDVFPRYKTMRGYRCERKAGWDTHGLPVEVEVCKELTKELGRPVHSKEDIETYGVEPFIQRCQRSVWRYMQEWERLTERLGFWVNLDEAYVTYHQSYVESVWWSLKELFNKDLLYQGHKIVWWWAQGGTALSAGEVGQGYRQVADPSVYVKFPLLGDDLPEDMKGASLLVWTTTPWTLPSNQFVAINCRIEYALVEDEVSGERLVLATATQESLLSKLKDRGTFKLIRTINPKTELIGKRYLPPFDCFVSKYGETKVGIASPNGSGLASSYVRAVAITSGATAGAKKLKSPNDMEDVDRLLDVWHRENGKIPVGWQILDAGFVDVESGTGIVHIAPAYGEADYNLLVIQRLALDDAELIPLLNPVGPDGKFTDEAPEFVRGRWVKDCDKDISRNLKERGLLFHQEQYLHDYPFCWRAEEDPLIQYPRESWFIKTTAFKDAMLENNQAINWLPEHIKGGRMGKFLESNVDWALSRERYWGTPLPIWQCAETGKQEAIGGYDELLAKPGVAGTEVWAKAKAADPTLPDDLQVHKPYIDAVTYDSPYAKGARMQRVPEVIDCWYDSGAMPFAQWGYKGEASGEATERFKSQFPADFISEALDQTRGWFYSQIAISTMLWSGQSAVGSDQKSLASSLQPLASPYPHPFKNCIVLGLMLGEDGQKMSKSKRNYRDPSEIFDLYGADALRWYLLTNQPPWSSIRYSEQAIKDSIPEFLLRLWNCYSFFVIYANIDGFDPNAECGLRNADSPMAMVGSEFATAKSYRPVAERDELDRWIISELHRTIAAVTERMDAYDNFGAGQAITEFVDGLSNWYVRRCRDRFWAKDKRSPDKLDAYWTLYECLVETAKLIAPFTPFIAEAMWRNLAGVFGKGAAASVHLCDYPACDDSLVNAELSERMGLVRLIASLGLRARQEASLKVRQPLAKVEVILADNKHQAWLEAHAEVIAGELNVKAVEFSDEPEKYVDHEVLPNFKLLGKKLGKLMPLVKQELNKQSGSELLANLRDNGLIDLTIQGQAVQLTPEEVEIRIAAKPGWAAANDRGVVAVLSTELTPELLQEGLARDLVRAIQDHRKELGCEFTERIHVTVDTDSPDLETAVKNWMDYIKEEVLSVQLGNEQSDVPITLARISEDRATDIRVGELTARLLITRFEKA